MDIVLASNITMHWASLVISRLFRYQQAAYQNNRNNQSYMLLKKLAILARVTRRSRCSIAFWWWRPVVAAWGGDLSVCGFEKGTGCGDLAQVVIARYPSWLQKGREFVKALGKSRAPLHAM